LQSERSSSNRKKSANGSDTEAEQANSTTRMERMRHRNENGQNAYTGHHVAGLHASWQSIVARLLFVH
jgi:hypothetical protein